MLKAGSQKDIIKMQWERSSVIGLAKASCNFCHGYGMRPVLRGTEAPCKCVFRAVFRACYRRFRECVANGSHTNAVTWERCGGPMGYRTYSRKREEYIADFCLVSRRTLEDVEHRVFRAHYLLSADWKLCCRQLKIDRGEFFHHVYDIEDRLGRVFAELAPYALYPVSEYFAGPARQDMQQATTSDRLRHIGSRGISPLPLSA
jgi:hypothetical protein